MLTIGTVYLRVQNLNKMVDFYRDVIGLQVHDKTENEAHLGVGADNLLVLTQVDGLDHVRGVTDLFHFALLVPTRADLARWLMHFAQTGNALQGLSDHLVSEAIYLADPEGNGIEVYRDRERDAWFDSDGKMQMATIALDIDDLMRSLQDQASEWTGLPTGTVMGHIHLHVDNVPQARHFYNTALTFDTMFDVGSAIFLAHDGYHHHVGANIWGVRHVAPQNVYGLDRYELRMGDDERLQNILAKLDAQGQHIRNEGELYHLTDSAQNHIVLRV